MDLKKAQRLLTKIEAFVDNGNAQELSRLEKDLLKSYVIQLYDALTDEASTVSHEHEKLSESFENRISNKEVTPKTIVQPPKEIDIPKVETSIPRYHEPVINTPKEQPVEAEVSVPVIQRINTVVETKSPQYNITEPVEETIPVIKANPSSSAPNEALAKLFELPNTDGMSGRFSHVPIESIESAMGLNERIFTLNELFGGDKVLFDTTCSALNKLNSFADARTLLMAGPAKQYKWSEPERIKMAEQFIRIVSRRYPKSVS
jgi:hypothetical protein